MISPGNLGVECGPGLVTMGIAATVNISAAPSHSSFHLDMRVTPLPYREITSTFPFLERDKGAAPAMGANRKKRTGGINVPRSRSG
jgi:hypothetical protein